MPKEKSYWALVVVLILTLVLLRIMQNPKVPEPQPIQILETIQEEEEPPRYGFTDHEVYLLTVLLCGDGRVDGDGEYDIDYYNQDNFEQISLVMNVVMNRVMSDSFPRTNTVSEVVWANGQFHPMIRWAEDNLPPVKGSSYDIVKDWCDGYDRRDPEYSTIPESHLYFYGNGTINISRERW